MTIIACLCADPAYSDCKKDVKVLTSYAMEPLVGYISWDSRIELSELIRGMGAQKVLDSINEIRKATKDKSDGLAITALMRQANLSAEEAIRIVVAFGRADLIQSDPNHTHLSKDPLTVDSYNKPVRLSEKPSRREALEQLARVLQAALRLAQTFQ